MFKIQDGRTMFYQWDIDRKLIVEDANIKEVHFCNKTDECSLVCNTYVEEGLTVVNVPNILLQDIWRIYVYAYDRNYTKFEADYSVKPRSKPADYVYTETEVLRYETLEERIEALENGGGGGSLPDAAAPNQQLVSDKDGNTVWEERTHYSYIEGSVWEEILPHTTNMPNYDGAFLMITTPFEDLVAGDLYKVIYDGVEYECIASKENLEGITILCLGNVEKFKGTGDTGEPFLFGASRLIADGVYAALIPYTLNGSSSDVSISIQHYVVNEVIKILDEKYLPERIRKNNRTINIYIQEDGSAIADATFIEAWEMSENELQSAIVIHNYKGNEEYAAFAVGKVENPNYMDYINISYQPPTDLTVFYTTVLTWASWPGVLETLNDNQLYKLTTYQSLPLPQVSNANNFLYSSGGGWGSVMGNEFVEVLNNDRACLNSINTNSQKKYTFTIDDDKNINIYNYKGYGKPTDDEEIDSIVKKSDLDAALAALVDGEEVKY